MSLELIILGSSSATPVYNRHPTAQLLTIRDRTFLIDCGEGTLMQLLRYRLRFHKISHIFISHLHGDHYLGLLGLLSTFHLQGRQRELHLYGQQELMDIVEMQLRLSNTRLRYHLIFHPVRNYTPELIYEDENLMVNTLIMNHRIPCTGFVFREKKRPRKLRTEKLHALDIPFAYYPRLKEGEDFVDGNGKKIPNAELTEDPLPSLSYAYCSDTLYEPSLTEHILQCDLLYHEATFLHEMEDRARLTYHSTALQAASIARDARVKELIIGHFSARYKNLEPLLDEARTIFSNTRLAIEGENIRIG